MAIDTTNPPPVRADVFECWAFCGAKEYGNEIMAKIAKDIAASNPTSRPLVVKVQEHGGWALTYYFDGTKNDGMIVGTANDTARFDKHQESIQEKLYWAHYTVLPEVRRQ